MQIEFNKIILSYMSRVWLSNLHIETGWLLGTASEKFALNSELLKGKKIKDNTIFENCP